MPGYTQTGRPLSVTTPLGKDVLLLTGFEGSEAISRLFHFRLDLLAEKATKISFDGIVGQDVTVELKFVGGGTRYFNGLVNRFTQGGPDETFTFTHFHAEVVPKLWLLTRKVRSRIFQHLPIPEILKQVLTGFPVKYELTAKYEPRDYCAQYRESDFAFASRLMEEEGIYYFFKHSNGSHEMTVTDVPALHPDVPGVSSVSYEETIGGVWHEPRILAWEKTQELRSGKYTVWDHCFQLPEKHLEAQQTILGSVTAGTVTHKLQLPGNKDLEIYEYPGGYAQRFDGIDKGGGERPADLQKIFTDNERTVKIRMEQEESASLEIAGGGDCGAFLPGHQFTLRKHPDASGPYLLTRVDHTARLVNAYRSVVERESFTYENRFAAIPAALPYRPARTTPRPTIPGVQTATVVGPAGEEIYCDKYGRVKVQFHWDREGKKDLNSSCWIRVSQPWAGKGWGAFFWPRIGNEVVVAFEEGDPDQPQIVGSVYNAENMPPYVLPAKKQFGGIRSASVRGKSFENFNAIVFVDEKGREHLGIHSERNMSFNAEYDKMFHAGRHKGERVANTSLLTVGNLPGGGGSGGGTGDWVGKPTPSDPPQPLGVAGLNAIVVYGENLQAAVGLNHQLALGSNLQICINPFGLAAGVGATASPALSGVLGSGLGGNMQFTIGTSANFVLGQEFDINLGPKKFTVDGGSGIHSGSVAVCVFIGLATLMWVVAYGMAGSDADRASGIEIFQVFISALLATLMLVEEGYKLVEDTKDWTWKKLFAAAGWEKKVKDDTSELVRGIVSIAVVLGAIAAPAIAKSIADS